MDDRDMRDVVGLLSDVSGAVAGEIRTAVTLRRPDRPGAAQALHVQSSQRHTRAICAPGTPSTA